MDTEQYVYSAEQLLARMPQYQRQQLSTELKSFYGIEDEGQPYAVEEREYTEAPQQRRQRGGGEWDYTPTAQPAFVHPMGQHPCICGATPRGFHVSPPVHPHEHLSRVHERTHRHVVPQYFNSVPQFNVPSGSSGGLWGILPRKLRNGKYDDAPPRQRKGRFF